MRSACVWNDILLPIAANSFGELVSKLRQVGLDRASSFYRGSCHPADAAQASGEASRRMMTLCIDRQDRRSPRTCLRLDAGQCLWGAGARPAALRRS